MRISSKHTIFVTIFALWLLLFFGAVNAEEGHEEDGDHEDESGALVMTTAEQAKAGIETGVVEIRAISEQLRLPGEVLPNAYKSAKIAPRITAQVVRQLVRLGEPVEAGQPMITLSSVEMAAAQGDLLVADQEWQRVQALGKDVLSGRRFTEAQVGRQSAMAKVLAYGMSEKQAKRLLKAGDASLATGQFDVLAPLSGTVVADDFVVGELIDPGRVIFEISDETSLWIEARVSAGKTAGIAIGTPVRISSDQELWYDAVVVQIHHRLDETTRTQAVRIEFNNENDLLHPGEFVEVEIAVGNDQRVLAIPTESVVLMKGETVVFLEEGGGEFHSQAVSLGTTYGDLREVLSGLREGDVIVTAGTYFLKSMVLKSEMGEGHAH